MATEQAEPRERRLAGAVASRETNAWSTVTVHFFGV